MLALVRRRPLLVGIAALVVAAALLRIPAFTSYSDGWDPSEFVWAVEAGYLPHSPYVLYLWVCLLASKLARADIALSAVSFVFGLVSVGLVVVLVRRLYDDNRVALLAGAFYAAFAVAVEFSGVQETYAMHAAMILAAFLAGAGSTVRAALVAGLLFGAAIATHNGTALVGPAFAWLLWQRSPRATRLARFAAAAGGAVVMPAIAFAWLALVFSTNHPDAWFSPWLTYLKGIAPAPGEGEFYKAGVLSHAFDFFARAVRITFGGGVASALLTVTALASAVAFAARAWPLWLLFIAPFSAYAIAVGGFVDPGTYVPYIALPIAALAALGIIRARDRFPGRAGLVVTAVVAVALLAFAAAAAIDFGRSVPTREQHLAQPLLQKAIWMRDNLPLDAYVVQPHAAAHRELLDNVTLLPCYTRRRPIIFYHREFLIFAGRRWSPLNLRSFIDATDANLDALVRRGVPIVGLVADPAFTRSGRRRWRTEQMSLAGGRVEPFFVLDPVE